MNIIKKENWVFCLECDSISYKFDCCGNLACTGGGCNECKDLNREIWKIVNEGKSPNKDEVPHVNDWELIMSSDFLDLDDDSNGSTVSLSMKASGDAFLTVSSEENLVYYHLSPNEVGWKNAEKIVEAINNWVEHTKSIV